jgi:hypothetical protein
MDDDANRDRVDADLLALTHGDPARARVLREALQHLRRDNQPELRELAEEVLAGRTRVRAAMLSDTYAGALAERREAFVDWYKQLSPAELQQQRDEARAQLDELRERSDR